MTAINQNMVLWCNNSYVIEVDLKNQSAGGDMPDLAGATVKWWAGLLNDKAPGDQPVITKVTGAGVALAMDDDGNWRAQITLAPTDTADVKPGVYYHELSITDTAGRFYTPTTGEIRLNKTVGR